MNFVDMLENFSKVKIEVSDLRNLNVEWYDDLNEWDNCMWSWVFRREPYKVKEDVLTIKASILDLSDKQSLKRFRKAGSKPTYHFISLEKLLYFMNNSKYTHIFIYEIGELNQAQISILHDWIVQKQVNPSKISHHKQHQ